MKSPPRSFRGNAPYGLIGRIGGIEMSKRIGLFLVTNLAIMLVLSLVLSLLGVGSYVTPDGRLQLGSLMVFCLVWGMGGAFISLQLSRWIAKRSVGIQLIDGRSGQAEIDAVYEKVANRTGAANLPMPEVGVYDSAEV